MNPYTADKKVPTGHLGAFFLLISFVCMSHFLSYFDINYRDGQHLVFT